MLELTVTPIERRRGIYLALSTLTLLFLGLIYAFSMFVAPMCMTFNLEKGDVAFTFNIMMICFCLGAFAGSQLEKVIGIKWSIILSGMRHPKNSSSQTTRSTHL